EDRKNIEPLQGQAAPEFEGLQWVQGGSPKLADQKGKVVLLVFWAQWCGPCVASLPRVEELQNKYSGQGLVVLAVHDALGARNLQQSLAKLHYTLPVAVEQAAKPNIRNYAVKGFPTFTFIDRAG